MLRTSFSRMAKIMAIKKVENAHGQSVTDITQKDVVREQEFKLCQSYEFRSEEAVFGFVVLKGHYPACQWNIIKYDAVYKKDSRTDHQKFLA